MASVPQDSCHKALLFLNQFDFGAEGSGSAVLDVLPSAALVSCQGSHIYGEEKSAANTPGLCFYKLWFFFVALGAFYLQIRMKE